MLALRTLSLALVTTLGLVPLVPAEHVHEIEAEGHHQLVVHQHSHFHALVHLPEHQDGRIAFDHPDDPILTLTTVFIVPLTTHLFADPGRLLDPAVVQPPPPRPLELVAPLIERPIHGPPGWRFPLRGPPSPLSLT